MSEWSPGLISYGIGFGGYLLLLMLFIISRRTENKGTIFIWVTLVALLWNLVLVLQFFDPYFPVWVVSAAELIRNLAWFTLLLYAAGPLRSLEPSPLPILNQRHFIITLMLMTGAVILFSDYLNRPEGYYEHLTTGIWWKLLLSIVGLLLVEQLYRNSDPLYRWHIKILCLSLGAIFIFDFYVYSNALLFKHIDPDMWNARGLINALIIPGIMITAARNQTWAPELHISRRFVFHSTILVGAGIYLMAMAFAGYYIKIFSGNWGPMLQTSFLFGAMLVFTVTFLSSTIQAKLRDFLNRNFFSSKYNYRDEWTRFSSQLLESSDPQELRINIIKAIASILDSQGGSLWTKKEHHYQNVASWMMDPLMINETDEGPLYTYLMQHKEAVSTEDFFSYLQQQGLQEDHWFPNAKKAWLIIPLFFNDNLYGFIFLRRSMIAVSLDSEDRELLQTTAHHASLFLAHADASNALNESQKFSDLNKMTTFLVHDLKTLLSQLFLLLDNAKLHKNNPAFIEDMLSTLKHVTQKMDRLIKQLREPQNSGKEFSSIQLNQLLARDIAPQFNQARISPSFQLDNQPLQINGQSEKLKSAIKHIIQNGIEACAKDGKVEVILEQAHQQAMIRIIDNGKGMDQRFIETRLFQPFDSTKGVSGMGIGVYQTREIIKEHGGRLSAQSEVDQGTQFTISLPLVS